MLITSQNINAEQCNMPLHDITLHGVACRHITVPSKTLVAVPIKTLEVKAVTYTRKTTWATNFTTKCLQGPTRTRPPNMT